MLHIDCTVYVHRIISFDEFNFWIYVYSCFLEKCIIHCILRSVLAVNRDLLFRIKFLKKCRMKILNSLYLFPTCSTWIIHGILILYHKTGSTTILIILGEFLMFYQILLSPQTKPNLIISNKLVCRVASRVAEPLKEIRKV